MGNTNGHVGYDYDIDIPIPPGLYTRAYVFVGLMVMFESCLGMSRKMHQYPENQIEDRNTERLQFRIIKRTFSFNESIKFLHKKDI